MSTTTTAPAKEVSPTKVITGIVRLSYAHIFEPSTAPGSTVAKYSGALIIPKSDKATLAKINAAVEAAKEQGKAKFGGKIPANLKLPLRDGDIDRPDDDAYANSFFLNASSGTKPGIIDLAGKTITEQDKVYSGCYIRASINFYPFNTNGSKGIAAGLNNIMFVKDGDALSGRDNAETDFAEVLGEDANDDFM